MGGGRVKRGGVLKGQRLRAAAGGAHGSRPRGWPGLLMLLGWVLQVRGKELLMSPSTYRMMGGGGGGGPLP